MIQLRQEEVAFYHELGRALTAWADVEYELCVVALNCFDGGKPISKLGPVTDFKAAFFSIENFRSKLQFSNVLVSRHLQGSVLLTEWAGLLRRLEG